MARRKIRMQAMRKSTIGGVLAHVGQGDIIWQFRINEGSLYFVGFFQLDYFCMQSQACPYKYKGYGLL